jgi:hypothetical protein
MSPGIAHPFGKAFLVDGAIEQAGRIHPVTAKRRHESQGFPMPIRGMRPKPLAFAAPAPKQSHVGLDPCLVDEDEPGRIDPALIFLPLLPSPLDLDLLARNPWAFANAVIVIAGELTLGVLQGIALGVVLSLLTLIYLTSHPKGAVLGQLPETEAYRDVLLHPEAITFPGLLIWRMGGDLFFASIGHVRADLKASLHGQA